MSRRRWHMLRDGDDLTLARVLPARFDVVAETTLPDGSLTRLAHQIRQDLWRSLQGLRGFSPVIHLSRSNATVMVRAGGRVDGAIPETTKAQIAAVLQNPANRDRWQRFAAHRVDRAQQGAGS